MLESLDSGRKCSETFSFVLEEFRQSRRCPLDYVAQRQFMFGHTPRLGDAGDDDGPEHLHLSELSFDAGEVARGRGKMPILASFDQEIGLAQPVGEALENPVFLMQDFEKYLDPGVAGGHG